MSDSQPPAPPLATVVALPTPAPQPAAAQNSQPAPQNSPIVALRVAAPFWLTMFDPSIDGCPVIGSDASGSPVPSALADKVIAAGAAHDIVIERV